MPKRSHVLSVARSSAEEHKHEMQRTRESVDNMFFLSGPLTVHSRVWLFLCQGEKTNWGQLLTGALLSHVGEVQVYSTYRCILQRQNCD